MNSRNEKNGKLRDAARGNINSHEVNASSEAGSHKREARTLFARLHSPRLIALGVVAGLIFSLFTGVLIIFTDMMSGVTFSDETFSENILAKDLTDNEWLGGLRDDERKQLDDDFDSFQSMLADPDPSEVSESDPSSKKTRGDEHIPAQTSPKLVSMEGIENIVLFGVDSRSDNFRGRADVTMLISLNHNNRTLNLVSLMRAMYVKIGTAKHPWGMLNASYSYGGPNLAVRTIERNFGIPIKGYVAVNFNAFKQIINTVGGVHITLTEREAKYLGFEPGYQLLNGSQALQYARLRKIDSDFQRNQRQRNIVNSVLSAMSSGGVDIYNAVNVALANTRTNLNLRQYVSTEYLSYTRRQLQLPAMSDTWKTYVRGMEVWPFKMANTHTKLVNFLTGK